MSYKTRDANQSDTFDVVLLYKQFSKEIPHKAFSKVNTNKTVELISSLIEHENGFVHLATFNDEVVGVLAAVLSELPVNDFKMCQEIIFFVEPKHRNGKTSSKLIDAYVEWSKSTGCNFVRLSSLDPVLNSKAGILFKRKGFSETETAYVKEL